MINSDRERERPCVHPETEEVSEYGEGKRERGRARERGIERKMERRREAEVRERERGRDET